MTLRPLLATLALLLIAPLARAAGTSLELPLLFSDGAVLQRDRPLPVWGQAEPGAQVTVALDGRSAQAMAGADGRWSLQLPAHAAGGPYELVVRAGTQEQRVRDVLVGEVWLASGQSNMEWPVAQTLHAQEDIAAAGDGSLRHFKIPKSWAETPQAQLQGGAWKAASPATVGLTVQETAPPAPVVVVATSRQAPEELRRCTVTAVPSTPGDTVPVMATGVPTGTLFALASALTAYRTVVEAGSLSPAARDHEPATETVQVPLASTGTLKTPLPSPSSVMDSTFARVADPPCAWKYRVASAPLAAPARDSVPTLTEMVRPCVVALGALTVTFVAAGAISRP